MKIAADEADVLINLGGHTRGSDPVTLIMARRPAPGTKNSQKVSCILILQGKFSSELTVEKILPRCDWQCN